MGKDIVSKTLQHRKHSIAIPSLCTSFTTVVDRDCNRTISNPTPLTLLWRNFEAAHDDQFLLVTQNIDNLHQRAGSQNVLPMHGELMKARCCDTGELFDWPGDLSIDTPHPHDPARIGRLRPHVVWFGEMPYGMEQIDRAARAADVFIAIGTSAIVYPAAGIVTATRRDCRKVEINLDDTPATSTFDQSIRGKASVEVPKFLESLS